MRWWRIQDKVKLKEFQVVWEQGINNLADYQTKHFPPSYHTQIRPTYILKEYNLLTHSYVRGCVNHSPRGYPKTYTTQFTEPIGSRLKSPRKNQNTIIATVNTRSKHNSHRIQTDICLNSNHMCQLLFKTDPMTIIEPMTIPVQDITK